MTFSKGLLIAALALVVTPAWAGTACFTAEQRQAEQWVRLHSELMVVAVTCRQDSYGQSLSDKYVSFTHKNIRALHKAEQTLISYYKSTSKRNPVERLDALRTRLGNEGAHKAAKMSAPEFCRLYRDDVTKFEAFTPQKMTAEIRSRTSTQPCGDAIKKKKRK